MPALLVSTKHTLIKILDTVICSFQKAMLVEVENSSSSLRGKIVMQLELVVIYLGN